MAATEVQETSGRRSDQAPKVVPHFTAEERAARGRAARAEIPRRAHGEWEPSKKRPDPVGLLEEQAASRVPELVPIRYGRMLVSPFTFYRGAAYLMASDLSDGPRSGLSAQLCGDAHLSNFGIYAAPDRRLIFNVNDFDETLPGPFEWDVKRLVASFAVAGRDRGFDTKTRAEINRATSAAYRESMATYAGMRNLDIWYDRIDVESIVASFQAMASSKQRKRMDKNLAKARTKDSLSAFNKLTEIVDGEPRIVSNPPLIVPIDELAGDQADEFREGIQALIRAYRRTLAGDRRKLLERYRFVDLARKVVGVGSVGTRAWIVLMLGRDGDDPLFLQAKEAESSVLEPFVGKSEFANHGQRVVEGQRLMQAASDIFLGWLHTERGLDGQPRDFYLRQLWDAKGSAIVELMNPKAMTAYGRLCGQTLAKAHARSGDAIAIASYLGTSDVFDQAMAAFAETYADQNEADYAELKVAVDSGRIKAETGY
ncbi:MAG TPA: DUF2252 domain-containing protein [Gaiellaceae bacterium]|nr:DUF2252 domain-containing protein [Gaiellaceae bacterium]